MGRSLRSVTADNNSPSLDEKAREEIEIARKRVATRNWLLDQKYGFDRENAVKPGKVSFPLSETGCGVVNFQSQGSDSVV
jgi:hypothetical protein